MPSVEWNKIWNDDLKKFKKLTKQSPYGCQWGDPGDVGIRYWMKRLIFRRRTSGDLSKVVKYYIKPYVTPDTVVLEIGSGGGRWTKYLLAAKEIIAVDLNPNFFSYLRERFRDHLLKFRFYHTSGCELDGVETDYVDFIFTFGTFVHIDPDGIYTYLNHMKRIMRPGGVAVIHYSDKTKKKAQKNRWFSDMNPGKMEKIVSQCGFSFVDHNTDLLDHSSIAVIQK